MKIRVCWIVLATAPFLSCAAQSKSFSKEQLNSYFSDDKKVIQLVTAASNGNIRKIDELKAQGVNVNYQGKNGITPLMAQAGSLNIEGFKKLLENGADPNMADMEGYSVMNILVRGDKEVCIEMLRLCLQHGGNPNWKFHNNPVEYNAVPRIQHQIEEEPLLTTAISSKYALDMIKLLLEAGADINAKDSLGKTPIMVATSLQRFHVVLFLLQSGADYTIKDKAGNTLIQYIERDLLTSVRGEKDLNEQKQWRKKVVEFLKEKGIEVHLKYPD